MNDKEKIYDTLGELLYVVAKADGVVQVEERNSLTTLLKDHDWAREIEWSFDYEVVRDADVEQIYNKVINYCKKIGPRPEYTEFISAMHTIAEAVDGIGSKETEIITSFSKDLIEKFTKDVEDLRKQA